MINSLGEDGGEENEEKKRGREEETALYQHLSGIDRSGRFNQHDRMLTETEIIVLVKMSARYSIPYSNRG